MAVTVGGSSCGQRKSEAEMQKQCFGVPSLSEVDEMFAYVRQMG